MAIELKLEDYCQNCRNFEAKTVKRSDSDKIQVECNNRQQCKLLAQYLLNKIKYGGYGRNE